MRNGGNIKAGGWFVTAGVFLVMALVPIDFATAQPGPAGRGPCEGPERLLTHEDRQLIGDRMMQRMQDRLGLSQEQANEIRGVLQARRDQVRGELQQLCDARGALRQLLGRQDADPATVKAAADKVKSLQGAMLDQRVDTYLDLRSKLTAEQWQKWIELRQHTGRRSHRHGRGV